MQNCYNKNNIICNNFWNQTPYPLGHAALCNNFCKQF